MVYTRLLSLLSFLSLLFLTSAAPSSQSSALEARSAKTIQFTVSLTWEDFSPVGAAPRKMILTNGTFPGPALNMNVGDTVEFLVHNKLPFATSVHFHGITQLNTPWSDGVPGLSQAPIQPGSSFLYKWTADEYGTYFYHAHMRSQIMDGLYGAIKIQPKASLQRPFSYINNDTTSMAQMLAAEEAGETVFISDWSNFTAGEFYDISVAGNIDNYCMDAILINGKGSVYCQTQDVINSLTNPRLAGILAASTPSQMTLKGCLPAIAPAVQDSATANYTFNPAAIPPNAFDVCNPSTGPMATFSVDPANGWASMSFINTGGISGLEVSIDSHKMWVYSADGRYVEPQAVDALTVFNGERYSVLIQLNQQVGQYAIRVANTGLNQIISGFAVLSYVGSTGASSTASASINYAGANTTADFTPLVPALLVPFPNIPPSATAEKTFFLDIMKTTSPYLWTLGGVDSYNMSLENRTPLLFNKTQALAKDTSLVITTKMGQWVDLIVQVAGPLAEPHPIHKHSNKAYIIGSGLGPFNYSSVAEAQTIIPESFNLVNPQLRDGFTTTPAEGNSSWMALRYQVVNPGAFFFHCHVQTHLSGGMAMAILDGVDKWPKVPAAYLNGNNGIIKSV